MLIAIDPSQDSLGLAIFTLDGKLFSAMHILRKTTTKNGWHAHALQMAEAVKFIVASNRIKEATTVIIETPANWFSERGEDSKHDESIQKLYFTTGAICASLINEPTCMSIWGVPPSTWKGQTPKDIMLSRARNYCAQYNIDITKCTHDVAEAILLGKYAFKHLEITDHDFTLRFQEPITQIAQSNYVTSLGHEMDEVPSMRDLSMFDFTYYSR